MRARVRAGLERLYATGGVSHDDMYQLAAFLGDTGRTLAGHGASRRKPQLRRATQATATATVVDAGAHCVEPHDYFGFCYINYRRFRELPYRLARRLLSMLLRTYSGQAHPPRTIRLSRLMRQLWFMTEDEKIVATLNGCRTETLRQGEHAIGVRDPHKARHFLDRPADRQGPAGRRAMLHGPPPRILISRAGSFDLINLPLPPMQRGATSVWWDGRFVVELRGSEPAPTTSATEADGSAAQPAAGQRSPRLLVRPMDRQQLSIAFKHYPMRLTMRKHVPDTCRGALPVVVTAATGQLVGIPHLGFLNDAVARTEGVADCRVSWRPRMPLPTRSTPMPIDFAAISEDDFSEPSSANGPDASDAPAA